MKTFLRLLWCWLMSGLIIWSVQILVQASVAGTADPLSPAVLSTSAVLAALATWLISRQSPEAWARWLGVLFAALLMAGSLACLAILALASSEGFVSPRTTWGSGGAFLVGLVAGVLICRRGILRGVAVSAAIAALTFALVIFLAQRQKSVIRDYEERWASMGWAMDLKSLYPMPYSKPQCQPWFDAIAVIAPKKDENKEKGAWEPFSDDVVVPLCSDTTVEALRTGQDLKAVILSIPAAADSRWPEYRKVDAAIRATMEQCPHVQWFDPAEYGDRTWDVPIPNLRGLMRWSRGSLALAELAAASGRFDEAQADLDAIHRGAGKMLVKGQTRIGTHIGIAMDRLSLIGEAGMMAMGSGPLPAETRERIEKTALQDLDWFSASWKVEFTGGYSLLKSADVRLFGDVDESPIESLPLKPLLYRALLVKGTESYLSKMTLTMQSLEEGCRPGAQKFGWKTQRSAKPMAVRTGPTLGNSYARALSLLTQARLVLMMDEVLKYRQEHNALPETLDFVQTPWRTDPFDEKPLRYKKEGDDKFVVYSVGPDGRDDGAQTLYVSGVMETRDELKQDIGFRIALPPASRP